MIFYSQNFSTICWISKNYLEFFFFEAVLEEHQNWYGLTIDFTIFHQTHQTVNVHGFTREELQLFESAQDVFHYFIHIGLEKINLIGLGLFQFGNQSVKASTSLNSFVFIQRINKQADKTNIWIEYSRFSIIELTSSCSPSGRACRISCHRKQKSPGDRGWGQRRHRFQRFRRCLRQLPPRMDWTRRFRSCRLFYWQAVGDSYEKFFIFTSSLQNYLLLLTANYDLDAYWCTCSKNRCCEAFSV